jgi:Cupin-like domain
MASLAADVPPPPAVSHLRVLSTNMWLNASSVVTSVHYDPHHNLLCCVCGSKTVRLWPPACAPHLRPFSVVGESCNHSSVRVDDAAALAAAVQAAGDDYHNINLRPGDVLIIPAGWWHLVSSSPKSCAINYWCDAVVAINELPSAAFCLRQVMAAMVASWRDSLLSQLRAKVLARLPSQSTAERVKAAMLFMCQQLAKAAPTIIHNLKWQLSC